MKKAKNWHESIQGRTRTQNLSVITKGTEQKTFRDINYSHIIKRI